MTATQNLSEIVRVMERGQVTIPINIRRKLKISPQAWLWIKLTKEDQILIEPVEKKSSSNLLNYLKNVASDTNIYWTSKDDFNLNRVKQKSLQRLKKVI